MSEEILEEEKKVKKPKSKARKIVEWALTIVFGIIFVVFAFGQIQGMIHSKEHYGQTLRFGYLTFVVETDSMEPKYKVGTAIITHYDDLEEVYKRYQAGEEIDIQFFDTSFMKIAPQNPKLTNQTNENGATMMPMCHRLQEMYVNPDVEFGKGRYIFVAAGINIGGFQARENQYQAFSENEYLGVVKVSNPILGAAFQFMMTPWGYLVIILIPTFYLVITSVLDIFKAFKETDDEENVNPDGTISASAPTSLNGLSEKDIERLKKQMLEEMMNKKNTGGDE